jgi:hypothetical protein
MSVSMQGIGFSVQTMMDSFDKISEKKVEQVIVPVMEQVRQTIQVAQKSPKANEVLKEMSVVTKNISNMGGSSNSSSGKQEIHIYIDGKELNAVIKKVVNEQLNIRN